MSRLAGWAAGVALVAGAVAGCATSPAPALPPAAPAPVSAPASGAVSGAPGCEPYARTELFFGTTRTGGPPISDQEFHAFLDSEITPRFPDGLTVLTGSGQFRGSDGRLVVERSVIVVLLYPAGAGAQSSAKIDQIRLAYREKFQQESVLRADDSTPPCVSF